MSTNSARTVANGVPNWANGLEKRRHVARLVSIAEIEVNSTAERMETSPEAKVENRTKRKAANNGKEVRRAK